MLRAIGNAFSEAFYSLRSNFFQTILSVLGIIIGVGALVAMLSLIDGLEQTARERIADKTSLENVVISAKQYRELDGIRLKRDTVARLDVATTKALMKALPYEGAAQLRASRSTTITHPETDSLLGVRTYGVSLPVIENDQVDLRAGRMLTVADQDAGSALVVINRAFARRLIADTDSLDAALGQRLNFFNAEVSIAGVIENNNEQLVAILPVAMLAADGKDIYPDLIMSLNAVDEVTEARDFTAEWLTERYAGIEDAFDIASSEFWLDQLEKGFLLFRVVMSLLVGIGVVVGGVGVMNVLLMSISARTAEIGVRKAVGANRKHIMTQFLSESVAISIIGSIFGLLLGILVSLAVAPVFSYFVPDIDFRAVFTLRTLLTVGVLAVIVGIIFGTYPARRAAGLDPVEAIRRS